METAVAGTLESPKYPRTSGCTFQTDIEVAFKWPRSIFIIKGLSQGNGAVGLCDALVLVSKAQLG